MRYAVQVMGAILLSTVAFCLETVPAYSEDRNRAADQTFMIIETVTVQIFAADYLLRYNRDGAASGKTPRKVASEQCFHYGVSNIPSH